MFINSEFFLSGNESAKNAHGPIIFDHELAIELAFEQMIDKKYLVWHDVIENIISEYRFNPEYKESDQFLDVFFNENIDEVSSKRNIQYRKKKIKKENTPYDDFVNEVVDDAYYTLRCISTYRYIHGYVKKAFFERVFDVYKAGLYPCGMKKNKDIVAFDLNSLR